MHQEIQQRVNNANRAYFSIVSLFKSKLLSRESKVRGMGYDQKGRQETYNV